MARELKYNSQSTDFSALQRELGHPAESGHSGEGGEPYADEGYEDEESWVGGSPR
ncbi:MAG: DUF3073 domain-containing protein [Actinomycetota bacterium]|nr:DUF3073 domain-containing protein [Actinomycetota bacterium]